MPNNLTILERSTIAGITIADEALAAVRKLIDEHLPAGVFLTRLRSILEAYEPILARTLSDAMIAAWVDAQIKTINRAKLRLTGNELRAPGETWITGTGGSFGPPTIPPIAPPAPAPDEPEPVITYPKIHEAASDLAQRRIILPEEYYALSDRAKQFAFSVSKIGTLDALEKIRGALVADVEQGGTLRAFRKEVEAAVGKSALSPARIELVYRNNVIGAFSRGQKRILQHPLVKNHFPYVIWYATHDSRVRPEHLAFEKWGIGGGPVYRSDDPLVLAFWPPFFHACRCKVTMLTLEMAAERYNIEEAKLWLASGNPPQFPAYVPWPASEDLPPHWGSGPMDFSDSIAMSHDVSGEPRDERGRWTMGSSRKVKIKGIEHLPKKYEAELQEVFNRIGFSPRKVTVLSESESDPNASASMHNMTGELQIHKRAYNDDSLERDKKEHERQWNESRPTGFENVPYHLDYTFKGIMIHEMGHYFDSLYGFPGWLDDKEIRPMARRLSGHTHEAVKDFDAKTWWPKGHDAQREVFADFFLAYVLGKPVPKIMEEHFKAHGVKPL